MSNLMNFGDYVRVDYDMSRLAFVDLNDSLRPREWTYGEFEESIEGIANGLLNRGLRRGDSVAIMAANGARFIQAYVAIMRVGMVAVPINFKLPRKTIQFIFKDAAISLVFVDADREQLCPPDCPAIIFDEEKGKNSLVSFLGTGTIDSIAPERGDIAEILYTSGSTGRPKGVLLDHFGQSWAMQVYTKSLRENYGDRTLIVAPCYHMNGLFLSLLQLNLQGTIISLPQFDAEIYIKAVAKYGCKSLSGVPSMFSMVIRLENLLENLDLSGVTSLSMGSAPASPELLYRVKKTFPNAVVRNVYGTTEAGPAVFGPHPDGIATPVSSLGHPLDDVELRLGESADVNYGVLKIRAPALMLGYRNLQALTKQKIVDGWYDTGDEMHRDGDGFYYFVGRSDDMFVCGGENIHPGDVEKMLAEHEDIAQVAVVPVVDEIKGQIPAAFIVKRQGSELREEDVKAYAIENGPAYSHPRLVCFKDSIPLGGTQKVDRKQLIEEGERIRRG